MLAFKTKTLLASSSAPGYRSCALYLILAGCLWGDGAWGQSPDSGLQVPVLVLPTASVDQQILQLEGYFPSGEAVDPLSYYQRSRLSRWECAKDVDQEDAVFGIELETATQTIRIRCETMINGQPFRATREKTIGELLAIGKGPAREVSAAKAKEDDVIKEVGETETGETETETGETEINAQPPAALETAERGEQQGVPAQTGAPALPDSDIQFVTPTQFIASADMARMIAYARSRGSLLTRDELRSRVADIAGGPALLRTNKNFGAQRHKIVTLFAFLDADEDGVISSEERRGAVKTLNNRDIDSDGQLTMSELQLGLGSRSAERGAGFTKVGWRTWDTMQSDHTEDLNVHVSFNSDVNSSSLKIGDSQLDESWDLIKVRVRSAESNVLQGPIVMLSHPKVAVTLSAVQSADQANVNSDQISIGVTLESNALFRELDQNGDGSLSTAECDSCADLLASLDKNANDTLEASELPILLRVCVAHGAIAHQALSGNVSIVPYSDDEQAPRQVVPDWFFSMDKDGDGLLARDEFVGGRESFDKMDVDKNDLLSVEEVQTGPAK